VIDTAATDKPDSPDIDDRYGAERVALNTALTERVSRAQAAMTAALAELLDAVTQAEDAESYWAGGSQTAAEWLAANLRVHGKTARSWIRMAKQLREFPTFRAAMAAGDLNVDQVRQLLKFVDPEDQDDVLPEACFESAEDLEIEARKRRRVTPKQVKKQRSERWAIDGFDYDDMIYRIEAEIPGYDGLVVQKAMQLLAWNAPEETVYELPRHPEHRLADALVEMASNALANTSDHDIGTVVVHADATTLHLPDRVGTSEFGPDVPMETIRRLTCDGRLQLVAHADDGCVLGVGRVTRTIPPWLRRIVRQRDKGCRFPGCRRTYWTQIHHIIHWANGGPTELHNLVTLCGHHHRMLHEDQWSVRGDPAGDLEWLLPGGTRYNYRPGRRTWETMRDLDLQDIEDFANEHPGLAKPGPG